MLSCSPPALWSCLTPAVRVPCPSQHSFLFTAPGELTPSSTHSRNCKHTICSTSSRETANTACLQTQNSPWNTTSISHLALTSHSRAKSHPCWTSIPLQSCSHSLNFKWLISFKYMKSSLISLLLGFLPLEAQYLWPHVSQVWYQAGAQLNTEK